MPYCGTYYFGHLVCEVSGRRQYDCLLYHHDFLRFHTQLVERAKKMGKRFRAMHEEQFQRAEYPELLDDLNVGEQSIVDELLKNGRRRDEAIWQVINYRMYRQIQAIASGKGSPEGVAAWVGLFNGFMKSVAPACASSVLVRFDVKEEFVPYLIDHVLTCLDRGRSCLHPFQDERKKMADFLGKIREKPPDEEHFAQFLEWTRLYQSVAQQEFDEGE